MSPLVLVGYLVALVACPADAEDPPGLKMSKPVVCAKVQGLGNFEPLPDASLTADDKLTVYYEPSGQTIEKTKDGFRALLAQDGRVRKKGGKDILWQKAPMFEYEPKFAALPFRLFMRSDLSIKGLPPGDYELDLTLHDRLAKGTKVMRTVAFRVVPAKDEGQGDGGRKAESPSQKSESGTKKRRER